MKFGVIFNFADVGQTAQSDDIGIAKAHCHRGEPGSSRMLWVERAHSWSQRERNYGIQSFQVCATKLQKYKNKIWICIIFFPEWNFRQESSASECGSILAPRTGSHWSCWLSSWRKREGRCRRFRRVAADTFMSNYHQISWSSAIILLCDWLITSRWAACIVD